MLVPGTMLGDRYEILELIGSGGMADVYKAKCHKLNRYVAVKVLKQEFSTNTNFVSKFRAEAQAAAGLMHPNIVNVYDVGEEEGLYYFVMELVEGITLKHYIEKKIRLSVKEAVSIAIHVTMGIEAAHNSGIIHRDIKPQNIIISKEGKVKVADFGIAKAVSSNTVTTHAMGSVHYTSPEQARGGYSDTKSDFYSIGITLFEMVTGRVPFDGETTVSIAIKHIQEELPSPRLFVPDIPVSVEAIINKCCQKNPDRRYNNANELIQDLKRSLQTPDENFVVINDPASDAGTKNYSETERREIRQQTIVQSGEAYQDLLPKYGNANDNPQDPNGYYYNENANQGYAPNVGYAQNATYAANPSYAPAQGVGAGTAYPQNAGAPNSHVRNQNYAQDEYNGRYQEGYANEGYEEEYPEGYEQEDYPEYYEKPRRKKKADKYESYEDGDEDLNPKMEKVTTILLVAAAIVIAIVAIVVVMKLIGTFKTSTNPTEISQEADGMSTVPNVVGKSVAEASDALAAAGLTAKATYSESTDYDKDFIISQDIEAGRSVATGTVMNLVVSSGKVTGTGVPDVVGKSEAEAKVLLDTEGFTMEKDYAASDTVAEGNVISQSPLGATTAPRGSSVKVIISSGKDESMVTVPNLVGKTEAEAKSLLENAGLIWSTVSEENNDAVPEGLVLSQTYAADSTVPAGTNVDFTVSLGAGVYTYACNIAVSAPANYFPGSDAIIVLMDSAANEITRYTANTFPYTVSATGIVGSETGYLTVTYLNAEGQWDTTTPTTVTFTKE